MEDRLYWFWLLITCIVVVFGLKLMGHLWWTPRRIEQYFSKQGINGPTYHFFIGNIKELVGLAMKASSRPMPLSHNILPRVLPFYHHWKKIYGATFLVWFGPTPRVTIADPVLIREIFTLKSDMFEKNESPPLVKKLEGDGLLALQGAKWAHRRKIITPTFHMENLKLMIPMMTRSTAKMLDKWSENLNCGQVEIEVSQWFQTLTEEVITHMAFGSSYEEGRAIFKLQAQQMVFATESFQRVFIPGYRFLPTRKNRISWRLDKEIRKSLMKLINERMKSDVHSSSCEAAAVSEECPSDLLEVMIRAGTGAANQTAANSNAPPCSIITAHDIVEECKTLFFAGKHTTSNLLTWTTILLAMHPHWQQLARDEVFTVCGPRDFPSKHHLPKLKTLGMILNESLRLYPPAVAAIRRAKVDAQLGVLTIPRGTELLIPIVAVHHDQGLWGQDASEFNPARFANGVVRASKHPTAYIPFGAGARRCIGQNLAVLQAKLAMAMILQRFSFELGPTYQHAPTVLMLLYPQHGAPVIFRRLEDPPSAR